MAVRAGTRRTEHGVDSQLTVVVSASRVRPRRRNRPKVGPGYIGWSSRNLYNRSIVTSKFYVSIRRSDPSVSPRSNRQETSNGPIVPWWNPPTWFGGEGRGRIPAPAGAWLRRSWDGNGFVAASSSQSSSSPPSTRSSRSPPSSPSQRRSTAPRRCSGSRIRLLARMGQAGRIHAATGSLRRVAPPALSPPRRSPRPAC